MAAAQSERSGNVRGFSTTALFRHYLTTHAGLDLSLLPPLEAFKRILSQPSKDRTPKLVQHLFQATKSFQFFSKLGEDAHYLCCQVMHYQYFPGDQFLFHQGDLGSQFYVILSGKCAIMLQSQVEEGLVEVVEYTTGEAFGELALLKNQVRSASVYCKTECHFAVLEKGDFLRIIGKIEERKLARKIDFLQKLPMFVRWTKGSLTKLSYAFTERTYRCKQVVYSYGDEALEIYFITQGEFQLMQPQRIPGNLNSLGQHGSVSVQVGVSVLSVEQCFGEEDVLDGTMRRFTCICRSETATVLVINKEVRDK